MRKIIVVIGFIFLLTSSHISYGANGRREVPSQPPPSQYQQPPQPPKPIGPPTVPTSTVGVVPTPSPHIAAPPVVPSTINTPHIPPTFSQPQIPTVTSSPVQTVIPSAPVHTELPQVPIMGNAVGEVLDIGRDKDGTAWIEMEDLLFNQVVKIKVKDFEKTPVTKEASSVSFEDIKIGDMVNIVFLSEQEENTASFIHIMTEEELKQMEEAESSD